MEGKLLNIPSYIEDPSYRYKMPALQLRIEGRLNGVKTKIVNCEDVAKALRVPVTYPLKYMGYELGSQTHDKDHIINGEFKEGELKRHMDKFIEKYVLCPNCHYPEMVIKVKKGTVTGSCNACPYKGTLDNVHKLAAYIVKNPPKNASEFKEDKTKKGVKEEKVEKPAKKEKDTPKKEKKEEESSGEEEQPKEDKEKEAKDKEAKDKEKKEKKEKKEEVAAQEIKTVTVYDFKANEEALIAKINEVYKKHASLESFEDQDDAINEIIKTAKSLEIPTEHQSKLSYLVFNAIFDVNIAKEVSKNAAILTKAHEELNVKDSEQEILLDLQKFLLGRMTDPKFEKYIPTLLKLFYDEDLLSEEFLIDWDSGKLTPKFMMDFRFDVERDHKFKNNAKQFINWLKSAETE